MLKVAACKRALPFPGTVAARLLKHDDPEMTRLKFDSHRLHFYAPKWERHLSSQKAGFAVSVQRPGSLYEDFQSPAPYADWKARMKSS